MNTSLVFAPLARSLRLVLSVAVLTMAAACGGGDSGNPTAPTNPPLNIPYSQTDLRAGTGPAAVNGNLLAVHYALWLYSTTAADQKGRLVQTSGVPYPFVLGTGNAIRGWHQGLLGMQVGGVRRLVLPPELAYGAAGNPPDIPGNATLIFEVELMSIQ